MIFYDKRNNLISSSAIFRNGVMTVKYCVNDYIFTNNKNSSFVLIGNFTQ